MHYSHEISIPDMSQVILRYLLGLTLLAGGYLNMAAQEITVYYDPGYVDNCNNNTCEAFTLDQFLNSLSYETETFEGLDSAAFFNALSCKDVFFLPETEAGDFAQDLLPEAKSVIQDFVSSGGLMFVMGSDGFNPNSSNSARNLNSIFGFNIDNDLFTSSGFSYINDNAGVSYLNQIPDSVRNFTTTNFISDIPSGAEVLYQSLDGANSVVDIPYGSGHIVFLGWSFFNAGPIGSQGPDRWSILIQSLMNNLQSPNYYPDCIYCDDEPPRIRPGADRTFTGFFNRDGLYNIVAQGVKNRYEDNCGDFSLRFITDSQLSCSNGEEQEVIIELEDLKPNTVRDTLRFLIRDTVAPDFSFFPDDVTIECNEDLAPAIRDTLTYIEDLFIDLDIDSLEIFELPFNGWRFPSGTNIIRTEVLFEGDFNTLDDLWVRVRAVPGNSSLLYDGQCIAASRLNAWFSSQGIAFDCSRANDGLLFRSVNENLGLLNGPAIDSFVFDILNLGGLEGVLERVGVRFIYESDLTLPTVEEACGYTLSYTDTDNRGNCPVGSIVRRFEVEDNYGNTNEGFQIINVVDSRPVLIDFPEDYYISCAQGRDLSRGLHPDSLPMQFSYPIVNDECLQYRIRYSDQLVDNCGIHDQTFIRTWNVSSDCDPDTNFIHRQELRILDTVAPDIEPMAPYQVIVDDQTCLAGGNFFFPSRDSVVFSDCDSDPQIEMRLIDSSGVEFNPTAFGVGNYFV
jgi:hypothetical protein